MAGKVFSIRADPEVVDAVDSRVGAGHRSPFFVAAVRLRLSDPVAQLETLGPSLVDLLAAASPDQIVRVKKVLRSLVDALNAAQARS